MSDRPEQSSSTPPLSANHPQKTMSAMKIFAIVAIACVLSTFIALGSVYLYLFHGSISPVELSSKEEQALEQKLDRLDTRQRTYVLHKSRRQQDGSKTIQPERYNESNANREIILSERELNALLAKNTDLASKLAIDLSADLASAKLLIPLDEEFPVFGGKTLKVTAGIELAYRNKKPVVVLRGISLWGVPIPSAWMGNIKNVDLVKEFGNQEGFWKAFSEGVDEIEVRDGELKIRLKE